MKITLYDTFLIISGLIAAVCCVNTADDVYDKSGRVSNCKTYRWIWAALFLALTGRLLNLFG